jgi:hypothetical protein
MALMYAYELHLLGWHSFQQLCLSIAREVLGQTVESFLDSNDGGRDGAFNGSWRPNGKESLSGNFVIQCKFSSKKDANLKLSDLNSEFAKVSKLVANGKCDCYVLLTNLGISGQQSLKIEQKLKTLGVKEVLSFGSTWICEQIHENRNLRTSVPRLYGLGDLSEILDSRAYSQARALLASMREELAKVVITDSYRKASKALNEHGFVLLVGEPAAGKTTIASMLAMAALDQWGAATLKLDTPGKVIDHWNSDSPSQLFWIDDAFGVTQYESSLARDWNHKLSQVKTMLGQGIKIIMTSRDYIYNRARNDLKTGAFPLLQESQVVIDVHDLSLSEKQQILYNHLKLGNQPKEFKQTFKPFLDEVVTNDRFVPETARRLAEPLFTKGLHVFDLPEFVTKQESFLQELLRGIDLKSQAALGLIYMRNDNLESPIVLQPSEEDAITRMGGTLAGCVEALIALKGSLVQFVNTEDHAAWRFKHPTIGDAFAKMIVDSPELLEIYLQGSSTEKLLTQITCGDVGLEKAIIIPKNLFNVILTRLRNFKESKEYKSTHLSVWGAKRSLHTFLGKRCSKNFLIDYLKQDISILKAIASPGLYLDYYSSEIDLVLKLHDFGILPEQTRVEFVKTLSEYAIDGDDLYALEREKVQKVFTEDELKTLEERILAELVPNLSEVRRNVERNFSSSEDTAEEYMERYLDSLKTLQIHLGSKNGVIGAVEKEILKTKVWVEENTKEEEPGIAPRKLENVREADSYQNLRSIFDDVDD